MSENIPPTESAQPGKVRSWLGPAFLASLAINLFLIGLIAAPLVFHGYFRSGADYGPGPVPMPFLGMPHGGARTLPPDERAALREMMMRDFPAIKPFIAKANRARLELADTIGAEPYDIGKVKAAFDKVDSAQLEMAQATRAAMIEGFAKMTPAQRSRIAEAMRKQAMRHMERGRPGNAAGPAMAPPPSPDSPLPEDGNNPAP